MVGQECILLNRRSVTKSWLCSYGSDNTWNDETIPDEVGIYLHKAKTMWSWGKINPGAIMKHPFFLIVKRVASSEVKFIPYNLFMIKIPILVFFVPRLGILSTTTGRKNTRPWYKTIFP